MAQVIGNLDAGSGSSDAKNSPKIVSPEPILERTGDLFGGDSFQILAAIARLILVPFELALRHALEFG